MNSLEIKRDLYKTLETLEGQLIKKDFTITALLQHIKELRKELKNAERTISKNQILSCKPKAAKVIGREENMPIPIRALD